ncbi:MAG: PAS domain-containing sensor histidine kinase [Bdellovibrionaceae bacterium]|nr:PAS domain-containing sensor histidine kinase [Bdellovibrio sp.]
MSQSQLNGNDNILKRLEEHKFALDQSAIVAQTDAHGTITYINDKFCEISGYNRNELIGKNHRLINSHTHLAEFFKQMWETIRTGKIWKGDICNRTKSGSLYWVSTTIVPLLDSSGTPHQYLAIRQDITALKEAQQTIIDQQSQLIANSKLSAIGEMAATITHEINNPLGVILGRCEMMKTLLSQGDVDINNLHRLLDTIDVTAHRIDRIVKSMKTLSHEGQDDPKYKTFANTILTDLTDLFSEKFQSHGIQFTINNYDQNISFECRSHEIMQILVNLLNNSFDAVLGKDKKWIRIDVQKKNSEIEISIIDSGTGIKPDIVEKLFMPFFSTKRVLYGTGLGLSISRSLIQRHAGLLEYDSASPFTRFVITIPIKQPVLT